VEKIPLGGVALIEAIISDLERGDIPDPLPTVTVRIFGPTPDIEITTVTMENNGPTTASDLDAGLPKGEKYRVHYAVPPDDAPGKRYTRIEVDVNGEYGDRGFIEKTFVVKR
jgi:hypothetical protein